MKESEPLNINNETNALKEVQPKYPLKTIMLSGGKGVRLGPITKEKIPKCFVPINSSLTIKGIDYLDNIFKKNNITDVVFSANFYYSQYEEYIKNTSYSMLYQGDFAGNGGAVEEAIEKFGDSFQYLVISPDTFFNSNDLNNLIKNHKPGTISWGVGKEIQLMDSYFGLIVDKSTKAILGDTKLNWWKNWNLDGSEQYVKGAINIIDPIIFTESISIFKKLCKKNYPIDLYWDILPLIEERNRRRILKGQDSFLQAIIFKNPIIDYGTPERLELVQRIYNIDQL